MWQGRPAAHACARTRKRIGVYRGQVGKGTAAAAESKRKVRLESRSSSRGWQLLVSKFNAQGQHNPHTALAALKYACTWRKKVCCRAATAATAFVTAQAAPRTATAAAAAAGAAAVAAARSCSKSSGCSLTPQAAAAAVYASGSVPQPWLAQMEKQQPSASTVASICSASCPDRPSISRSWSSSGKEGGTSVYLRCSLYSATSCVARGGSRGVE